MKQKGMTLLEVLIAVTLLSLLSVGMLFALRAGLTSLDAVNRRVINNRRSTSAQRILQQQVGGFLPVLAMCGANPGGGGSKTPFFQGQPNVTRFVTTYSLQGASRGLPQIVELFVVPGENGLGFRLVVNEIPFRGTYGAGFLCQPPAPDPMTGATMVRFAPPLVSPISFVLADKLAFVRFSYLESHQPEPDKWVNAWTWLEAWPRAIRIEMGPLAADPTRIPPMTFTGEIHVTRPPQEFYVY